MDCEVSFKSGHSPIRVEREAFLPDRLTCANSPVLFGCRTGICGTCASLVCARGTLAPPSDEENETLRLFCPGEPSARLLCQLKLTADVCVEPLHP